jgi:3-phenylpropionate/trans-cinnamate dioxygenase ferredoxin reductase component
MSSGKPWVIVGANLTGGRAAEALRQGGFDGRLVLVGGEPERPYERPPLSKEFLRGEAPEEKLFLAPVEEYENQRIELRLGVRATRLDSATRTIDLASGERIEFERLLIATGASPRRLDVPGANLAGIHYLRTKRDADSLRSELVPGRRAVIVGAGFIGAEVAASCRQEGLAVTVLEALPVPLRRALGDEVGELYAEFHRAQGVDLRTGEGVQAFRGTTRVEEVVTASGKAIPCDFVVVGIGVVPQTDWLAGSGVALDNGVVVDERCETNVPGVFAAGDVANWWHPTLQERLRVEHFDNAQNQAVAAAKAMLGKPEPYAPVLFFWSDQYDLKLQYVGHASRWDRTVFRGDRKSKSFAVFYLLESRVRAALGINRFKDVSAARKIIQRQTAVSPEQLADPSVDLKTLA